MERSLPLTGASKCMDDVHVRIVMLWLYEWIYPSICHAISHCLPAIPTSRFSVLSSPETGNTISHSRICLLGENGNGKTTLLKIIMDVLKPTEGMREYICCPDDDDAQILLRVISIDS